MSHQKTRLIRVRSTTILVFGLVGAMFFTLAGPAGADDMAPQCTLEVVNPLGTSADLEAVVFGGGRWIAVGEQGTIVGSANGDRWEETVSPAEAQLSGVAWGHGRFVAVGEGGVILSSEDGQYWHIRNEDPGVTFNAVAAGDSGFVVVGFEGVIGFSPDGLTWTFDQSQTNQGLVDLTWTGSLWVAVGWNSTILTSSDGLGWQLVQVHPDQPGLWTVHSSGGVVIAPTRHPSGFLCSRDGGHNWDFLERSRELSASDLTSYQGRWLSVGSTGFHQWSPDGIYRWSSSASEGWGGLNAAAAGPDRVIGVGPGGHIAAGDGRNWHWVNSYTRSDHGMGDSDGQMLAVTHPYSGSTIRGTSSRMEPANGPYSIAFEDLTWGNGRWVAPATNWSGCILQGALFWSEDALTWTPVDLSDDLGYWAAGPSTFNGQEFLVAIRTSSNPAIGWSTDGENWIFEEYQGGPDYISALEADLIATVASSGGSLWRRESDSPSWSMVWQNTVDCFGFGAMERGPDAWVAVGSGGLILSSSNGIDWVERESGTEVFFNDVRWVGNQFVAVGFEGTVVVSEDGATWVSVDSEIDTPLLGVIPEGRGFAIFGSDGLVVKGDCIDSHQSPESDFGWRPNHPVVGRNIEFFDLSTGNPRSWTWNFGDGGGAGGDGPNHRYEAPGTYQVSLRVANGYGEDRMTRDLSVITPCVPNPNPPTISGPDAVGGQEDFTVRWTEVPGAYGYVIEESPTVDFLNPTRQQHTATFEQQFQGSWAENPMLFYRVASKVLCTDGHRLGPWSDTIAVRITPSFSDPGPEIRIIPGVVRRHVQGIPADWTDLSIHNPYENSATVNLFLLNGNDDAEATTVLVAPKGTLTLEDIGSLVSSTDGEWGLMVGSNREIFVQAFQKHLGPDGVTGESLAARELEALVSAENEGRILMGPISPETDLVLGFANASDRTVDVRLFFFDEDGVCYEFTTVELDPWNSTVLDADSIGSGDFDLQGGSLFFDSDFRGGFIHGWGTRVESETGGRRTRVAEIRAPELTMRLFDPFDGELQWQVGAHGAGTTVLLRSNAFAWSHDSVTWNTTIVDSILPTGAVVWNGEYFLAVGYGGAVTSSDGTSWIETSGPPISMNDVLWDGRRWLAVGQSELLWESTDGRNWKAAGGIPGARSIGQVLFVSGNYIATAEDAVFTSPDLVTWSETLSDFEQPTLAQGGGRIVATSLYEGEIAVSSDGGLSWRLSTPPGINWGKPFWNGSRWFVWGGNRTVPTSIDGESWRHFDLQEVSFVNQFIQIGPLTLGLVQPHGLMWITSDGHTAVVPAVAQVSTSTGRWSSHLSVFQWWEHPLDLEIAFLKRDQANLNPDRVSFTLGNRASTHFENVLTDLFGTNGVGALRLHSNLDRANAATLITEGSSSERAQWVRGTGASEEFWWFKPAVLLGLSSDGANRESRSNIGVVSNCAEPMSIVVDVFSPEGTPMVTRQIDLAEFEVKQWNRVFRSLGDCIIRGAWARVRTDTPFCGFFTYGSVIEGDSGDPITVPGQPLPGNGTEDLVGFLF